MSPYGVDLTTLVMTRAIIGVTCFGPNISEVMESSSTEDPVLTYRWEMSEFFRFLLAICFSLRRIIVVVSRVSHIHFFSNPNDSSVVFLVFLFCEMTRASSSWEKPQRKILMHRARSYHVRSMRESPTRRRLENTALVRTEV